MSSLALFPEAQECRWGEFPIAGRTWRTSPVFESYWYFAAERQKVFFARLDDPHVFTADPILRAFKFTNAYRASDRVSQYLIRRIIYDDAYEPRDVFFRIILFKLFNKIETWELLKDELGEITWEKTRLDDVRSVLNHALDRGRKIYSGAYIMPSGGAAFPRKHDAHMHLLKKMMLEEVPDKLGKLRSMQEAFLLLRSFAMVGDFLAYQFVTDVNYSCLCNFSEMEFVAAGPGAKDGIRKCFPDLPLSLANEAIKNVCIAQTREFERRNLDFRSLWGRPLQFIDCQNLFCEVDKYARVAHPEIQGLSSRKRIKQIFKACRKLPEPFYPPKWNLPR